MKRIVRLTESDLTRIVRRVIREGAAAKLGDVNYGGKSYQVFRFGDDNIGYVDPKVPGKAITDSKIITALNGLTGHNIPASNGIISIGYIQKNPGFRTNLRNLI
jgi:hypothetical protein